MKKLYLKEKNILLTDQLSIADTFFSRLRGLMFKKHIDHREVLLIKDCKSVHNCFVYHALDLVFVDRDSRVVKIIHNFKPWRFSRIYFKAKDVFEFKSGFLKGEEGKNIEEGDTLEVRDV